MMHTALQTVSRLSKTSTRHQKPSPAQVGRLETCHIFGSKVEIETDADGTDTDRRQRENREIYERALASRVVPKSGTAVDIGAGDGWFGLAFAKAFPKWDVICIEPDEESFQRLKRNVLRNKLENVRCIRGAFHPEAEATSEASKVDDPNGFSTSLKRFVPIECLSPRYAPAQGARGEGKPILLPALSAEDLARFSPDLIKLDAPFAEEHLGAALKSADVGLMIGVLYAYTPSSIFAPTSKEAQREYYLVHRDHALRRDYEDNFPNRRPGLDIVVAMYNAAAFIEDCVDSLLSDGNRDIRVLVVDDGSTDGSGDLVKRLYGDHPRVVLLKKANGGCASARNFGRQHSDASHIAFIDADDKVDEGMFTSLLEVARYTGAFVTEGEFTFLDMDDHGRETLRPSYEAGIYDKPGDQKLGPYDYTWISGHTICIGQPTIWRRVHRRDFLDRKNIWFPEHVRAFDDQIFQYLVGEYCGALAHVRGYSYLYRQHPSQDIKQGDERHFYSFNMYRQMIIRSLDENWSNTAPLLKSLLNTLHWSYSGLKTDLKETYAQAAAKFLAIVSKTYGHTFSAEDLTRTKIEGLEVLVHHELASMADEPINYGHIRTESWHWQPEFIRMAQALPRSPFAGAEPRTNAQ